MINIAAIECIMSALANAGEGVRLRDKFAILFILAVVVPLKSLLYYRPRLLRTLNYWLRSEWCIKIAVPRGPARIIFNPAEASELIVVKEILRDGFYRLTESHDCLLDVGAFRGISTIFLADQIRQESVVAVEPNTENFKILCRRLSKHTPSARPIHAALGAHRGKGYLSGSGVSGRLGTAGAEIEILPTNEIVNLSSFANPVAKIDIEGAEEAVLPSLVAELPARCLILVETHSGLHGAQRLLERYEQTGFSVSRDGKPANNDQENTYLNWRVQR